MRVVGRAVFPAFGQGGFTPTDLGEGAAMQVADLAPTSSGGSGGYNFVLVRFAATPSKTADVRQLGTTFATAFGLGGCKSEACGFFSSQRPTDIADYARIGATPVVLAAVLGVLGVAVLAQLLVLSTRRRRARPRHPPGARAVRPSDVDGVRVAGDDCGLGRPPCRSAGRRRRGPVDVAAFRKHPRRGWLLPSPLMFYSWPSLWRSSSWLRLPLCLRGRLVGRRPLRFSG